MRCPTCKQETTRAAAGKHFPFCGARCGLVDLGKWLGEEYRVPDRPDSDDAPPPSSPDHEG
jgi:endogenous inhibitor of DNA gyrase (YacG/DUF329 family)